MNDEDLVKLAELSVTTLSAEEETLLANWLENETECPGCDEMSQLNGNS